MPLIPAVRPRSAPPYFHVLTKPTGAVCNLDCKYCFFLSKESLYPGSRFRMSDEVLEAYIRQVIEGQSGPQVSIAFQGGEPTLMGLDFFRRAVSLAQRYARPGAQIEYSLQTNGTLLNEAWCDFFRENNFLIGLSLDGPQPMHDAYRVDKGGAADLRQGAGRGPADAAAPGRVQHPLHRPRRQRAPPGGGLSLLPRRESDAVHPVHPHRGARQRRSCWTWRTRVGAIGAAAGAASTCRPAAW